MAEAAAAAAAGQSSRLFVVGDVVMIVRVFFGAVLDRGAFFVEEGVEEAAAAEESGLGCGLCVSGRTRMMMTMMCGEGHEGVGVAFLCMGAEGLRM